MEIVVDCAEGTTRQFAFQPQSLKPHARISRVSKIFITHMHADHIMGIVPLLRNVLYPPPVATSWPPPSSNRPPPRTIEIYGPAGLRLFVRQIMKMTLTRTLDKYVVHELLTPEDSITPCDPPPASDAGQSTMHTSDANVLHPCEAVGLDIRPSPDGFWRAITQGNGVKSPIVVDAGAILHRDPCIGYTFTEVEYPSRKLVILGDTYDPSAMVPLCIDPAPSLLIHEATDSCISDHADMVGNLSRRTPEEVLEKALSRGHSTPEMAGAFAQRVRARALILNHIGGRFPAPRNPKDYNRHIVMQDIEQRASSAWGSGKRVLAAWDFLRFHVQYHLGEDERQQRSGSSTGNNFSETRRQRPPRPGSGPSHANTSHESSGQTGGQIAQQQTSGSSVAKNSDENSPQGIQKKRSSLQSHQKHRSSGPSPASNEPLEPRKKSRHGSKRSKRQAGQLGPSETNVGKKQKI